MGFSTSAVLVIFAASMMYMASTFYPLADMTHHSVLDAEKISNDLWNEKLNTKIVITNWSGPSVTVYNNGSVALNSSKINVIYNGTLTSYTVNPEGVWPPKTSINVNFGAAGGRVKIISANGASDYAVS